MDNVKLRKLLFMVETGAPGLVLAKVGTVREVTLMLEQIDVINDCKFLQINVNTQIEHELRSEFSVILMTVKPEGCKDTIAKLERFREVLRKCGKLIVLALFPEQSDCLENSHLDLIDQTSCIVDFEVEAPQLFRPIFTFQKLYSKGYHYEDRRRTLRTKNLLQSELRGDTLDALNDAVDRIDDFIVEKKYISKVRKVILESISGASEMFCSGLLCTSALYVYLDIGMRFIEALLKQETVEGIDDILHLIIVVSLNCVEELNKKIQMSEEKYKGDYSAEVIKKLCFQLNSAIKACSHLFREDDEDEKFLYLLGRCERAFANRFIVQCDYKSAYEIFYVCKETMENGIVPLDLYINQVILETECIKDSPGYIFDSYDGLLDHLYGDLSLEMIFILNYDLAIEKLYRREYAKVLLICDDFLQHCVQLGDTDNTLVVRTELLKYWVQAIYSGNYESAVSMYEQKLKKAINDLPPNNIFSIVGCVCYAIILKNYYRVSEETSNDSEYSGRIIIEPVKLQTAEKSLTYAQEMLKSSEHDLLKEKLCETIEELLGDIQKELVFVLRDSKFVGDYRINQD